MIEKIETRIENHINFILEKNVLTHEDYMTLSNELYRLNQKEKEAKFATENKERTEKLQKMLVETMSMPVTP